VTERTLSWIKETRITFVILILENKVIIIINCKATQFASLNKIIDNWHTQIYIVAGLGLRLSPLWMNVPTIKRLCLDECTHYKEAMFMVFNDISAISWWSVLLVEETGVPCENYKPAGSHWQTLSHNVVSSTSRHERGPSWSWSYGSWIFNYLYNQCLSPLKLWVRTRSFRGVLETTLYDKVWWW